VRLPSVVVGDEEWLKKLDAATADDTSAPGDVRLWAIEERLVLGEAADGSIDVRDAPHEPAEAAPAEAQRTAADLDGRFARVESLLLDLARRVDRAAAEQGPGDEGAERFDRLENLLLYVTKRLDRVEPEPPEVPIDELRAIEVGVRAAAKLILRSSQDLAASVDSLVVPEVDLGPLEKRIEAVAERIERLASVPAPPPVEVDLAEVERAIVELGERIEGLQGQRTSVAEMAAFESSVAAIVAASTVSNPTTDAVRRLTGTIERLEQRLQAVEQRLDYIAEADEAVKGQLAEALRRLV
jgi:hypothetical protein